MAKVSPYQTKAGKLWEVRYNKPDRTQTRRRGFKTKRDATLWMNGVEVSKSEGNYVDPTAGKVTLKELGEAWMSRQVHWKPSYRRSIESSWNTHILPHWGKWPIASITRSELQSWIASIGKSRSTASRCATIMSSILKDAVEDQLIHSNRAANLSLPPKQEQPRMYLNHRQVEAFAEAAGSKGLVILTLAYTGLRWGELAGLHGPDVDVTGRRISVNRNAVEVGGKIVVGTPKNHELRTLRIPNFLADELKGNVPDGIVFPNSRGKYAQPPRASEKSRSWFKDALDKMDFRLTPHDLRHTAASLAVSSGANVKAVQRMLGHKSAAMTLDVYSDLFDSDLESVADSLDAARAKALG